MESFWTAKRPIHIASQGPGSGDCSLVGGVDGPSVPSKEVCGVQDVFVLVSWPAQCQEVSGEDVLGALGTIGTKGTLVSC